MKYKLSVCIGAWLVSSAALVASAHAQNSGASFYRGKTISIVVGFGPGGGYDLYARLIAQTLGEHIPGHPTVLVQNMPGAGGVAAADYVYSTAPKDGTVIAGVNQGAAIYELLGGKGATYDPAQLQWLGSVAYSNNTIYTWTASGVTTLADAEKKTVPMAGSGVISDSDMYPAVFNGLLGTKFKVIDGYTGTRDSDLAMERGEVDGRGGGAYSSLVASHPDWLSKKTITILAQIGFDKEPALPNVPMLLDLVPKGEAHEVASIVTLPTAIGYNYWVAPGVPKDRVAMLTKAIEAVDHDPAVKAQAIKMGLEIRPKSAAELTSLVARTSSEPKGVLARTKTILGW